MAPSLRLGSCPLAVRAAARRTGRSCCAGSPAEGAAVAGASFGGGSCAEGAKGQQFRGDPGCEASCNLQTQPPRRGTGRRWS